MVSEKFGLTRTKAQALIMAGEVTVEDKVETKSGSSFDEGVAVMIKEKFPYVSRGALKLEQAYNDFGLNFEDCTIVDVGASTGGFTDFSLQKGAKKVFAIDTGRGQIDQKLRDDERVVLYEDTNIKSVESMPQKVDFFVVDVSFISLTKVLPALRRIDPTAKVVALIKPQFEVGKQEADKTKGVIKDANLHTQVVAQIGAFAEGLGYQVQGLSTSPITGAKGNKEFLIYLN